VKIRERTDADLDACVRIAQEVHERDGYPMRVPKAWDVFIATPGALHAWVATDNGGAIVGHAALHPRTTPEAVGLACEKLLVGPDSLGVVARLFVAPDARHHGVARALVDTVAAEARTRGLEPILDVALSLTDAIALYDRAGWQRIGQVAHEFPDGELLPEVVYIAPDAVIRKRDWKS
jgi:ribosomal protein S18 acetylase RimI-like enzyme